MKRVSLLAISFLFCDVYSMGDRRPNKTPQAQAEEEKEETRPICQEYHSPNSCGFNYSNSYKDFNKPWGGYLKCQITFSAPGSMSETHSLIYYTNCGTCKQGALKEVSIEPGFTSVESPLSQVSALSRNRVKKCDLSRLSENTYDKHGWSFKIEVIPEGSTCRDFIEHFSFPSANSTIDIENSDERDACSN